MQLKSLKLLRPTVEEKIQSSTRNVGTGGRRTDFGTELILYIFLLKVGHIRVGGKDYVIEPSTGQATLIFDGTQHVVYQIDNSQDTSEEFTDDTFTVDMGN